MGCAQRAKSPQPVQKRAAAAQWRGDGVDLAYIALRAICLRSALSSGVVFLTFFFSFCLQRTRPYRRAWPMQSIRRSWPGTASLTSCSTTPRWGAWSCGWVLCYALFFIPFFYCTTHTKQNKLPSPAQTFNRRDSFIYRDAHRLSLYLKTIPELLNKGRQRENLLISSFFPDSPSHSQSLALRQCSRCGRRPATRRPRHADPSVRRRRGTTPTMTTPQPPAAAPATQSAHQHNRRSARLIRPRLRSRTHRRRGRPRLPALSPRGTRPPRPQRQQGPSWRARGACPCSTPVTICCFLRSRRRRRKAWCDGSRSGLGGYRLWSSSCRRSRAAPRRTMSSTWTRRQKT